MKNRLFTLITAFVILFISGIILYPAPVIAASYDTIDYKHSLPKESFRITVHFSDPNFEAAIRELLGKPTEDIFVSDVDMITELDVSGHDIADLTGIKYFKALEVLDCSWNNLTELDISQNIALRILDCSGGPHFGDGNYLTKLDISNNHALTELYCYMTELTELDLKKQSCS